MLKIITSVALLFCFTLIPKLSSAQSQYLPKEKNFTMSAYGGTVSAANSDGNGFGLSGSLNSFIEAGIGWGSATTNVPDGFGGDKDVSTDYISPYATYFQLRDSDVIISYSASFAWLYYSDQGQSKIFPFTFTVFRDFQLMKGLTINPEAGFTQAVVFGSGFHVDPVFTFAATLAARFNKTFALVAGPQYSIDGSESAFGINVGILVRTFGKKK